MTDNHGNVGGAAPIDGVDGLVAGVEKKMSELMAWHESRSEAFASEKKQHEQELAQERKALAIAQQEAEQARQRCQDKIASADRQREQLRRAAEALQARQATLEEELAAARDARRKAEQTTSELERQRTRAADQTQQLIDAIAGLDNAPVVIGEVSPSRHNKRNKQRARKAA